MRSLIISCLRQNGFSTGTRSRFTMVPFQCRQPSRPAELKMLADQAGLRDVQTRVYRPAFRITLVARP